MRFYNLYLQTEYSLTASPIKIKELMQVSKDYGYDALAMTDIDNMYGALKFYNNCINNGIKPIIGLNLSLSSMENFYNSILLYAKNVQGYKNLLKISTIRKTKKEVYLKDIQKYCTDLIGILPNDENDAIKLLNEGNIKKSQELIEQYKKVIDDLYIGLDVQTSGNRRRISYIMDFCRKNDYKTVAINKTCYLYKEDLEVYKVLKSIGLSINEYTPSEKELNASLLSVDEAINVFKDYPTLIYSTEEIVNKCNLIIEKNGYKMPIFDKGINSETYIHDLAYVGLKKRLEDNKINRNLYNTYVERLNYELEVINKMGFNDYFLIVYDFIKYAKRKGILVGPGRGSGPSSLVAYSLGITEIDPLKYGLLFERFLNPERTSMPDIDTDFPDNSRDEVIKYMGKRYGVDKVAHIGTFGTFGPRSAVRDVARVMKLSSIYLDEVLFFVPNSANSISNCLENPIFNKMYNENDLIKYLVDIVLKLEDLPRHVSIHAAGIIMADTTLNEYTALQEGINGLLQTQFEASDLEELGLVKIDFLGLKNLTIIQDILDNVSVNGKIDINNIPLDDKKTYEMIASGDTDGIFQLESSGMRSVLKRLKTSDFSDIVNALALYRPGPMEIIPSFVNRKFKKEKVEYLHNDLEEILKPTYGTIVFQEQILLIAKKFAGYSLGEADILRRAVSKKKSDILLKEQDKFITRAVSKGYSKDLATEIYNYILKFANYGFNKSHSVAYSMISYQMAYLKVNYYKEFMAVLMSNSIGKNHLLKSYFNNCVSRNIKVFLPSVNISSDKFVLTNEGIYASLLMVNGLGDTTVNNLLIERKENGIYINYDNFVERTQNILNRKNFEMLVYAGALDEFNIPRKQMILEYDKSLEIANFGELFKEQLSAHTFSDEEYTFEEISKFEKNALGFNFKFDIFKQYSDVKKKYKTVDICSLQDVAVGSYVNLLFRIDSFNVIKTKKGEEMAFVTMSDDTGVIDGVLFPKQYSMIEKDLEIDKIALGKVKVDLRDNKRQCVFEKIVIKKY